MQSRIQALARETGRLLSGHNLVLVTAESCTGGGIAEAVTSVPGSSGWFDRGFVTYSDAAKQDMLGVAPATLARHGAVSEAVVLAMARGAIEHSAGHVSVAISGVAGPEGGTPDKPVGLVWLAWGQKLGYAEARCLQLSGDRAQVREQSIAAALEGVVERLEGQVATD